MMARVYLTELEKRTCKKILSGLRVEDLKSLFTTVTSGQARAETERECIDGIVMYTFNVGDLLRRKKITRKLIFSYLSSEGVAVNPNGDKESYVQELLLYLSKLTEREIEGGEIKSVLPVNTQASTSELNYDTRGKINSGLQVNTQTSISESNYETSWANDNQIMAIQFTTWFFGLLNLPLDEVSEKFTTQHFYNDCELSLLSVIGNQSNMITTVGANAVVDKLLSMRKHEKVLFNVNNTSKGVKGEVQEHGLCCISACGSLHKEDNPVGVFEQHFGLIRDPSMENNWRIKFTKLKIICKAPNRLPCLDDMQAITM